MKSLALGLLIGTAAWSLWDVFVQLSATVQHLDRLVPNLVH
jgi:hypothetical protein